MLVSMVMFSLCSPGCFSVEACKELLFSTKHEIQLRLMGMLKDQQSNKYYFHTIDTDTGLQKVGSVYCWADQAFISQLFTVSYVLLYGA